MKTKTKKIILGLVIVSAIVFTISGLENRLRNSETKMQSAILNLNDRIDEKTEGYGMIRDEIEKYPQSKELLAQIDSEIEKLNNKTRIEEFDQEKYNEIISTHKTIDESIDKLIILFNDTKEMNEDKKLESAVKEYSEKYVVSDSLEKELNNDIVEYNKLIKKFPTNIIAKFKKLSPINELQ